MEKIERILVSITNQLSSIDGQVMAAWITSILAFLAAIIGIFVTYRIHRETIRRSEKDKKRQSISDQLNNFYRPFQLYLDESKLHYGFLRKNTPEDFILLNYLINRNQNYTLSDGSTGKYTLTENDKILIQNILDAGSKMSSLIESNIGKLNDDTLTKNYVPDPGITFVSLSGSGLLVFAKEHFKLMNQAYYGHFSETEDFQDLIFPKELPLKIKSKIEELERELNDL